MNYNEKKFLEEKNEVGGFLRLQGNTNNTFPSLAYQIFRRSSKRGFSSLLEDMKGIELSCNIDANREQEKNTARFQLVKQLTSHVRKGVEQQKRLQMNLLHKKNLKMNHKFLFVDKQERIYEQFLTNVFAGNLKEREDSCLAIIRFQGSDKPRKVYFREGFIYKYPEALKKLREEKDEVVIKSDESFKKLFTIYVVAVKIGETAKVEQKKKHPMESVISREIFFTSKDALTRKAREREHQRDQEQEMLSLRDPYLKTVSNLYKEFLKEWLAKRAELDIDEGKVALAKKYRANSKDLEEKQQKQEAREEEMRRWEEQKMRELKATLRQKLGLLPELEHTEQRDDFPPEAF